MQPADGMTVPQEARNTPEVLTLLDCLPTLLTFQAGIAMAAPQSMRFTSLLAVKPQVALYHREFSNGAGSHASVPAF